MVKQLVDPEFSNGIANITGLGFNDICRTRNMINTSFYSTLREVRPFNYQMSNKVGLFYSHLVMKKSVAFNLVKSKFSNNYHAGYYPDNQLT